MKPYELAYHMIYFESASAVNNFVLPFRDRNTTLANGRVLIVAMPYPEIGPQPEDRLYPFTRLELRQAHLAGLHLNDGAMQGVKVSESNDSIVDSWDMTKRKDNPAKKPVSIAIPRVSLLMKTDPGKIIAGCFTAYREPRKGGVIMTGPYPKIQDGFNWLCRTAGQKPIQLGSPHATANFRRYPPPRKRLEALKDVATKRRVDREQALAEQHAVRVAYAKRMEARGVIPNA